jgi:hypothetical protein
MKITFYYFYKRNGNTGINEKIGSQKQAKGP